MKTTIHAVGDETEPPISVGNPLTAADLAIDQSHMEEFATVEEGPAEVTCAKPPKGTSSPCARRRASPGRTALLFLAGDEGSRSLHRCAYHREAEEGGGRYPPRSDRPLCHDGRRGRFVGAQARSAGRKAKPGTGRR